MIGLDETGEPEWFREAACHDVGPDLFVEQSRANEAAAVAICNTCPVRAPCLAFALDGEIEYGVWGGTTRGERKGLLRERRAS